MPSRVALLRQFRVLIHGIMDQMHSSHANAPVHGFNLGMMREANELARKLGWRPANWDQSEHFKQFEIPFTLKGLWLNIFDAYSGGSMGCGMGVSLDDEQRKRLGGRLMKKKGQKGPAWVFSNGNKVVQHQSDEKQFRLGLVTPMLQSWITKADAELASDVEGVDTPAKKRGRKPTSDPIKDQKLHSDYIASGLRTVKDFVQARGLNFRNVDAAFKRVRARRSRNK